MNYVCLAAGKGTRFGNLGSYLQKCMYPVALTPFLEYSIKNLRHSNVNIHTDSLTIIIGHHGEQVQRYFGNNYDGLSIQYVTQPQALGTGHALHLAYEQLQPQEPVIAWLADAYVPASRFQAHQTHTGHNIQTIAPGPDGEKPDLQVGINPETTTVTRAWQGSSGLYDIGLWKLSPQVLSLMTSERHGEYRMMPNLQVALNQGHTIHYLKADEWLHLGGTNPTPEQNVMDVSRRLLELEARL